MTYLVTINFGGNEIEVPVTATSPAFAIAEVRATLTPLARRWANVFVA